MNERMDSTGGDARGRARREVLGAREVRGCVERARLMAESMRETEGAPTVVRRALALDRVLRAGPISISPGQRIVGDSARDKGSVALHPDLFCMADTAPPGVESASWDALRDAWAGRSVEAALQAELGPAGEATRFVPAPANPDWERLLRLGMTGLVAEALHERCVLSVHDPCYRARRDMLDAAEIAARAVVAWAERYAELARHKAAIAPTAAAADYRRVAEVCARVPHQPPETFHEAVQSIAFLTLVMAQIEWHSPTVAPRLDQLLIRAYRRDVRDGRIVEREAISLLEELLELMERPWRLWRRASWREGPSAGWSQSVTIGGVDEQGRDASNEVSHLLLSAAQRLGADAPILALRVHDALDPAILEHALAALDGGLARLDLYHDGEVLPAQVRALARDLSADGALRLGLGHVRLARVASESNLLRTSRRVTSKATLALPLSLVIPASALGRRLSDRVRAGDDGLARGLRSVVDLSLFVDSERALRLARGWSLDPLGVPIVPGVSLAGVTTTTTSRRSVNLLDSVDEALARLQEGSPLPEGAAIPRRGDVTRAVADVFAARLEREVARFDEVDRVVARVAPRPFTSLGSRFATRRGRVDGDAPDGGRVDVVAASFDQAARAIADLACGGLALDDEVAEVRLDLGRALERVAREQRGREGRRVALSLEPEDAAGWREVRPGDESGLVRAVAEGRTGLSLRRGASATAGEVVARERVEVKSLSVSR